MAANVRDRFDSGGFVAIRERPESALLGHRAAFPRTRTLAPFRSLPRAIRKVSRVEK